MLGRHIQSSQKRRIYAIGGAVGLVALIAWLVWPSGTSQAPPKQVQNPSGGTQTSVPSIGASPVTTTTNTLPKSTTDSSIVDNGQGKIVALSPTPAVGTSTTTTPTSVGLPTTTDTTSGITTTTVPPGATIHYGAQIDPRFVQNTTNPLGLTYTYSATASIIEDGQWVPVAVLPTGTLEFFTNDGKQCSMPVGGSVTGGTCAVTYSAFGKHSVVANYVVGGNTYVSVILADDVEPFGTKTVAKISGGGSLGGIVFAANVTDTNGNSVTAGVVSMTIADTTQGWSYVVSGAPGGGGLANDPSAFTCIVVGNLPRVGESSGCGFSQTFVLPVTPPSGDVLTETATYLGTTDWGGSSAAAVTYMVP